MGGYLEQFHVFVSTKSGRETLVTNASEIFCNIFLKYILRVEFLY